MKLSQWGKGLCLVVVGFVGMSAWGAPGTWICESRGTTGKTYLGDSTQKTASVDQALRGCKASLETTCSAPRCYKNY